MNKSNLYRLSFILLSLLFLAQSGYSQNFNPQQRYKLTTQFTGSDKPLDVVNGQVKLGQISQSAGQKWQLIKQGNGYYRIKSDGTGNQ